MKKRNATIRGFTLIEIIVSLGIFSVVAVIAVGALVRVTSANKQAQAIQSGVNNISFVLDTISREMRVGSNYECYTTPVFNVSTNTVTKGLLPAATCAVGQNSSNNTLIVFDSSVVDKNPASSGYGKNLKYGYLFYRPNGSAGNAVIYKGEGTIGGKMDDGMVAFYPVTSQAINIQDFKVGVYADASYPFQWVFIRLKGYVGVKIKDQSVFDIQTSVSERISQE